MVSAVLRRFHAYFATHAGKAVAKTAYEPTSAQSILVLQMNNLELAELLQVKPRKIPFLKLATGRECRFSGGHEGSVHASNEGYAAADMEEAHLRRAWP